LLVLTFNVALGFGASNLGYWTFTGIFICMWFWFII